MSQLTMTGDDWTSDRDRKAQARAVAAQKKTALAVASQLEKACKVMQEFMDACYENGDKKVLNADDGRRRLKGQMDEYWRWLDTCYKDRT